MVGADSLEKNLQLLIYGWGLREALYPDVELVMFRLHYLRFGKEMEVLLEPRDLEGVPQLLEEKIRVIEEDQYFEPQPGSFCVMCGLTTHCPIVARASVPRELMAPATREESEKAVSLLLTLQQLEKELATRLKEWVKANGPVSVGNLIYGSHPAVSYDLHPRLVTMILLEAGLSRKEVWPLLSISKTALERGLRKLHRQDLLEVALATGAARACERMEFRKAEA